MSTNETFVLRVDNSFQRKTNSIYYLIRNAFLLLKNHANLGMIDLSWYLIRMFLSSFFFSLKTFNFHLLINYFKGFARGCHVYFHKKE
jgi:hypothetical protein